MYYGYVGSITKNSIGTDMFAQIRDICELLMFLLGGMGLRKKWCYFDRILPGLTLSAPPDSQVNLNK